MMMSNRNLRDISPPKRIETERLLLRPYRHSDADILLPVLMQQYAYFKRYEPFGLYVLLTSPNVQMDRLLNLRDQISKYHKLWNDQWAYHFGAFLSDTQQFVAEVVLTELENHLPDYSLGYFGDVNVVGQGYLAEAVQAAVDFAFEHLQAHRVSVFCDDTDMRKIQAAERCGFIREAHLRDDTSQPDGTLSGTLYYGMLRSDYETQREQYTVMA